MTDTDDNIVTALKQANWDDILPRLKVWAEQLFRIKLAKAPRKTSIADGVDRNGERSAYGWDADSVVNEAVLRALKGRRKWNPEKCSLENFLKGAIKSIISDTFRGNTNSMQTHGQIDGPDGDEMDLIPAQSEASRREDVEAFEQKLAQIFGEDEQLKDLGRCLSEGITKPRDLADYFELSVDAIYVLKKKFIRKWMGTPHMNETHDSPNLASMEFK